MNMKKATIINLNRSIYYMNTDVIGKKDGFVIRLAKADDAVNYYEQVTIQNPLCKDKLRAS